MLAFNASQRGNNQNDYDTQAADISTSYDAILETTYYTDMAVEEAIKSGKLDECKAIS